LTQGPPITAFIALGANLGDREHNIRDALERLGAAGDILVRRVSSFLENPAVGGPSGSPPFLNATAEIETTLPPRDLLNRLLEVERTLGRRRDIKWAPRQIDLDLLLYGDAVLDEPDLVVPHPRMHERRFVLQPLAEIAPQHVHPVSGKAISRMLEEVPDAPSPGG
jgi:2-amino-4-hydroxy-6-hydroxymethyldihydropteridine diphosphokinase